MGDVIPLFTGHDPADFIEIERPGDDLPEPAEHTPFYIEEHVDEDVLMEFSDVASQISLLYEAKSATDLGERLRHIKRLVGDWPG